ncbi:hypothetical protein Francci3_3351 [Frankia casuarinae]|nr:hypothetical protein Francci3_3351 [Frankia casuarinae]
MIHQQRGRPHQPRTVKIGQTAGRPGHPHDRGGAAEGHQELVRIDRHRGTLTSHGHSPQPAEEARKMVAVATSPARHHQGPLLISTATWPLQKARSGGVGRVGLEPTTDGL